MKRVYRICVVVLLATGCESREVSLCGNGVLDDTETCDGALFSSELHVVCKSGAVPALDRVKCTKTCALDVSEACEGFCGDGVIGAGEQCDGDALPTVTAACEQPDLTQLSCSESCTIVDGGVCGEALDGLCGNGKLDEGELCDGDLFRDGAQACPFNMSEVENPVYSCLGSCRLVDVSQACQSFSECGNGVIEEGEQCDGDLISETALAGISCNAKETRDATDPRCSSSCQITNVCFGSEPRQGSVLISEVVPHFGETADSIYFDGIAVEVANVGSVQVDVSVCSLALLNESGVQKKYAFSELGITSIKEHDNLVICSQSGEDKYEGICRATISEDGIIENFSGMYYLGIVCGDEDTIYDLMNLNSFTAAVNRGAVDFIRHCAVEPATTSETAVFGDDWNITALTDDAPRYNLGSHCESVNSKVEYCKYTISRDTLTARSQFVDLALEIKVPDITDVSNQTDVNSGMRVEFFPGVIKASTVSSLNLHYDKGTADLEWTNEDGIDRYVGRLRNWDSDQGFWFSEAGDYTLDAWISFDNGQTYTYCGPEGIISKYELYIPSERNTIHVSYDDEGGVCGDGQLSSSEVCDGNEIYEETLICRESNKVITDYSKVSCYNCQWISTDAGCTERLATCGNGTIDADSGEVCEEGNIPESIKTCPEGYELIEEPEWECAGCLGVNTLKACRLICGNGVVDEGEACDTTQIPTSAQICPAKQAVMAEPTWHCNSACEVATASACEKACGNGKLDYNVLSSDDSDERYNEVCDGSYINEEEAKKKCGSSEKYRKFKASRAVCSDDCSVNKTACVSTVPLVFDEYLLDVENGEIKGLAVSLNNYSDEAVDLNNPYRVTDTNVSTTACRLFLTETGEDGVTYKYQLSDHVKDDDNDDSTALVKPCDPFVFCAGETSGFGDVCDVVLTQVTGSELTNDLLLPSSSKIFEMEVICGIPVDYFDYDGMRTALQKNGTIHGKLKAADRDSWIDRDTIDVTQRMDLDSTGGIDSFAKPTCSSSNEID